MVKVAVYLDSILPCIFIIAKQGYILWPQQGIYSSFISFCYYLSSDYLSDNQTT